MLVTKREKEILNTVIGEYVNSAKPVSSQLLEKKYDFGICPASIRIEMQRLTDAGFLSQPHTSAGRVPTDKGYRFFVNSLLEREGLDKEADSEVREWIGVEIRDTIRFIQSVTKHLAAFSSSLALGYSYDEEVLWKDGWEDLLRAPEFREERIIFNFTNLLRSFEEDIKGFKADSGIKIFIGRENPFPKSEEFSTIVSRCHFPARKEGILAILGPKRMTYEKNINSLNSLVKLLEKL
jgi:transcriptional regulator of heat shock response